MAVSGIWDNGSGRPPASVGTSSPTYQTTSAATARCEMPERATVAQLRYLERLLASTNTTWAMVGSTLVQGRIVR